MKSPAVLLYTSDFLTGTILLSDEETGKYIRLLCLQHQLYPKHIPESHMIFICNSLDSAVAKKFIRDKQGNYYNERMQIEIEKRLSYSKSRSNNRKSGLKKEKHMKNICESYEKHMDNDNDNENIKEVKNKVKNKKSLEEPSWRTDLNIYIQEERAAYNSLLSDESWIAGREKFHPGLDIKLSLEKAHTDFWGTEAGWNHKRSERKTKSINWKTTYQTALSMRCNQVWIKKGEKNGSVLNSGDRQRNAYDSIN